MCVRLYSDAIPLDHITYCLAIYTLTITTAIPTTSTLIKTIFQSCTTQYIIVIHALQQLVKPILLSMATQFLSNMKALLHHRTLEMMTILRDLSCHKQVPRHRSRGHVLNSRNLATTTTMMSS